MKATELITLTTLAALTLNMPAKDFSSEELQQRMIERRAVDAVIWGMPIVSLDAMRQAYFRDGKAKYGDIIWWPKGNDWKNQSLTPNTSLRYLYIFLNTKDEERRRFGRHLLRLESTCRSGVELDLHPGGEKVVPVVSILWPAKVALRQQLEDAGH